jgi:hypothetical protein
MHGLLRKEGCRRVSMKAALASLRGPNKAQQQWPNVSVISQSNQLTLLSGVPN